RRTAPALAGRAGDRAARRRADDECGRRGHGHRRRNHGRRRHGVRGGESDPVVRADCITFTDVADGEEGSLYVTPDAIKAGIGVGDTVKVLDFTDSPDRTEMGTDFVFIDFDRDAPMLALAIIYVIVVLLVAGFRGLRALLGLGFA